MRYQNQSHQSCDTSSLVNKVKDHVRRESLHIHTAGRADNETQKPIPDILEIGAAKLQASTIPAFNKQVWGLVQQRKSKAARGGSVSNLDMNDILDTADSDNTDESGNLMPVLDIDLLLSENDSEFYVESVSN